ncbi:Protein CASP [Porphyridium purpureum]|uniref:Protein CASP n=1 Tax=Porphyridium purpureum TaxID=35688 RepID=A0A5J4Z408_PORPP|nr:Protein CASP [Porphyridium purpureum]|eukprot:POR4981..scf295_1
MDADPNGAGADAGLESAVLPVKAMHETAAPLSGAQIAENEVDQQRASRMRQALGEWQAFGLDSRRAELDEFALGIGEQQSETARTRKQLAEQTRECRRQVAALIATGDNTQGSAGVAAAEVGSHFGALLKQYQKEIDRLTVRAKGAEGAFLGLYKGLYDLPDPCGLLERAILDRERVTLLENETTMLAEQAWDKDREIEHYGRVTEGLQAELDAQKNSFEEHSELVALQVRAELLKGQEQLVSAYEMREQELLHQLNLANERMRDAAASAGAVARGTTNAASSVPGANVSELDLEIQRLQEENGLLRRALEERGRSVMPSASEGTLTTVRSGDSLKLASMIKEKHAEVRSLQAELANTVPRAAYEQVKHELETLREAHEEAKGLACVSTRVSLEHVLDNDKVVELLTFRVKALEASYVEIRMHSIKMEQELVEKSTAVTSLESKLMETKKSAASDTDAVTDVSRGDLAMSSMLDTVTRQRDRLHVHAEQLEYNAVQLLQRIEAYLLEIKTLKEENMDLFEHVRRLGATSGVANGSSISNRPVKADDVSDEVIGTNAVLSKYETAYKMRREREGLAVRREQYRRVGSMNRAERFTYHAGEKLLQHGILRLAFFAYFCLFHLFVYATLISRGFALMEHPP